MTAEPAFPWASGQGGSITLNAPLTGEQIADGALRVTDGQGRILHPIEDGTGGVDFYTDSTGDTLVCSMTSEDNLTWAVTCEEGFRILNISKV